MISLRYPLLLILLLPGLWFAYRAIYRWGIPKARPASHFQRLTAHFLPILLMSLLILAASGPEWRSAVRGQAPVVDFAVVLDGSSSMLARDDQEESRWDAARRLLRTFILHRPDDRFSLILFSAHPITLSPLTADHVRLWGTLSRLKLDARDDGTAIGSALMTAVRRLSDSPARSRVILLLTDGAQNRGRVNAQQAAIEAKNQGIRIHTVALGKVSGESLYPLAGGGFAKLKVDTDPDALRLVALLTGGETFGADDPKGLERSLEAVDHLERTALPVDPPSESQALAHWFLMAAALLALPLAVDLAFKRGKPRPAWLT